LVFPKPKDNFVSTASHPTPLSISNALKSGLVYLFKGFYAYCLPCIFESLTLKLYQF
jgi:hypothetical protein